MTHPCFPSIAGGSFPENTRKLVLNLDEGNGENVALVRCHFKTFFRTQVKSNLHINDPSPIDE